MRIYGEDARADTDDDNDGLSDRVRSRVGRVVSTRGIPRHCGIAFRP